MPVGYRLPQTKKNVFPRPITRPYDYFSRTGEASCISIMASSKSTEWATAEDWAALRSTITELYVNQNKPLREVIDIMKRDYLFSATEKMYKCRFKKWGLSKNLTPGDIPEMVKGCGDRIGTRKPPTISVRGRPVDSKKVRRYLKRTIGVGAAISDTQNHNPEAPAHQHSFLATSRVNSGRFGLVPSPRRMRSPDDSRLTEEVIHLGHQLLVASSEGAMLDQTNKKIEMFPVVVFEFMDGVDCAEILLRRRHFRHAFKLLNSSFITLRQIIRTVNPSLFVFAIFQLIWLPRDLGQHLLFYISEMMAIELPAGHPMKQIWHRLRRAGIDRVHEQAWLILRPYWDLLETWLNTAGAEVSFASLQFYYNASETSLIDPETLEPKLMCTAERFDSLGAQNDVLYTKLCVAKNLLDHSKSSEAMAVIDEVRQINIRDHPPYNYDVEELYLQLCFYISLNSSVVEGAVEDGCRLYSFLRTRYGPTGRRTVAGLAEIQYHLGEMGAVNMVITIETILELEWEAFCQAVDSLSIGNE